MRAAHFQYLAKLHESGALEMLYPSADRIDRQTLKEEKDAETEIYDYAARFGLIPNFYIRETRRAVRARKSWILEVHVELPEQNINVVARGFDLYTAQVSAAIKFKEEAEKYHAQHGEESITIRDAAALNSNNVKEFFEFYRSVHKKQFELETNEVRGLKSQPRMQRWSCQVMYKGRASRNIDANIDSLLNGGPLKQDPAAVGPAVTMLAKKKAENVAYLVAAVSLVKDDPSIMDSFRKCLSKTTGGVLLPLRPLDMDIDPDAALVMEETLHDVRKAGLGDVKEEIPSDEDQDANRRRMLPLLSEEEAQLKSQLLKERLQRFEQDPSLTTLREKKASLPMSQYSDKVLKLIDRHGYSVIVGATGSGKTTQVPQILLEAATRMDRGGQCNVICTQPRRIAATSVARRVADERNEKLQNSVGYAVRFDNKRPHAGGSITYCTTGVLLQQLQKDPDSVLDVVSHIVIDEVHERDIIIDFLMIVVKNTINARRREGKRVPKVVLMSATIDSELFAGYFQETKDDGSVVSCPSLSVPGRTFPVTEKYLPTILEEMNESYGNQPQQFFSLDPNTKDFLNVEKTFRPAQSNGAGGGDNQMEATIDWKREKAITSDGQTVNEKEDGLVPVSLVAATIAHITKSSDDGAILAFLPGLDEMKKVAEALRGKIFGVNFNDPATNKVFMLHSSVPGSEQQEVFNPLPKECRKIILSTNIAETSVTIPEVQYIVDTGKLREKRYDQIRRITKLQCTWISKSNAKQRAGRAGRVQNGNYYALYSKDRFQSFRAVGLPEMLRSDLQEVCLDIKAQAFKAPIRQFLAQSIEPPAPEAVEASVSNLKSLEALTDEEQLTALGRLLASLPVHPTLGKMIVLGVIFRCLDPMIILGATLSERGIFVAPPDKRKEAQSKHTQFLEDSESDHYALINAFSQLRSVQRGSQQAAWSWSMDKFLHLGAFKTIDGTAKQVEEVLVDAGLIPFTRERERFENEYGHPSLNKNSTNMALIKALTLAGLHPNLAVSTGIRTFRTPGEKNALVHPGSTMYHSDAQTKKEGFSNALFTYTTMAKSNDGNSIFLRDVSASTPLMATLFGGRIRSQGNILSMDDWLPFYVRGSPRVVKTVVEFKKALDRVLTWSFKDLSRLKASRKRGAVVEQHGDRVVPGDEDDETDEGQTGHFADHKVRELFADGVVDVLNKDLYRKSSRRRGL